MIPCKENKCLLYPACQNKTTIDCGVLNEYHYDTFHRLSVDQAYAAALEDAWDHIHKHFPNVTSIRTDRRITTE